MEITESKVECTMFGEVVNLTCPSARVASKYYKLVKDVTDPEIQVEKSIEFLVSCGMPEKFGDKLELHQLEQMISLIAAKKK